MTMTRHQLLSAMGQARGGWAFCRNYNKHKPGHYPKAKTAGYAAEYRRLRAAYRRGEFVPEVNERGNTILRDGEADQALKVSFRRWQGDVWSFHKAIAGWEHLPTWQDADYFGVYFDRKTRRTFTYCEGDRVLVLCQTDESFEAEIAHAREFYSN